MLKKTSSAFYFIEIYKAIMNNENAKFNTPDFYLSAFLISQGFKLLSINKENPRKVLFVFQQKAGMQSLVEDFLFGRAKVNPKDFISAIRQLKQLLHSQLF